MKKSIWMELFSLAVIAGNILFVLWILYNGMNENFQGTTVEKIAYLSLIALLTGNAYLLISNRRHFAKK